MFKKVLVFSLLTIVFGQFDWDDGGIPLRQGIHTEWQRTASIGHDGEVIFVWSDTRDGGRDIFAQKVNSDGEILWQTNGAPLVTELGRQEDPIAISDENGGIFMIWRDYRNEPEHGDVYAQHVLSDGNLGWDIAGVPLSIVSGTQESLNMCSDGLGGVFVIWNDKSQTSSASGFTYGTHISASGEIVEAGIGVPIITSSGSHTSVSFENSGDGYASLVWEDARIPGEIDIYTQRIDSNCNILWGDEGGIPVCTLAGIDQNSPKVNHISDNRTVIVWEDERNGVDNNDIFLQILDELGNKLLENDGLNICSNEFAQFSPRVKTDSDIIFVVWEDERNDDGDIYAQAYSASNGILWEENGKPIASLERKQTQARLAGDGSGGVYFTWMDERNAVHPQIDIFFQQVNSSGDLVFQSNGIAISEASNYQFNPIVRKDNFGGAFVVFGDQQTGSIDMAVQHIDQTGTTFENNGKIIFTGLDGDAISPKLLYLGDNKTLAYWKDMRNGGGTPQTYGQIITGDFPNISELNGQLLCENQYQDYPSATHIGDHIFLNFLCEEEDGTKTLYYIVLDQNLSPVMDPNGLPIYANEWNMNQLNISVTVGTDNFLYVAYSDIQLWDYDIKLQKFDEFGVTQWADGGVTVTQMGNDDIVLGIEPIQNESGGCVVFWENNSDDTNLDLYAQAVDSDGNFPDEWVSNPLVISDGSGDQTALKTLRTDDGVFMAWKDSRNGTDSDIYGQFISDNGQIIGEENGTSIVTKANDQLNPSFDYDFSHNRFMVCWEDFENGMNYDVLCSEIDMSDGMNVDDEVVLAGGDGDQLAPFVYFKELFYVDGVERFMFVWEDSRMGLGTDIYYQEIDSVDNLMFEEGGIVICDADFSQQSPKIELYSEDQQSYVILWEDLRSSGKEELRNTYVQSRSFYEYADNNSELSIVNYQLLNAYPNPFNPSTTISYAVELNGRLSLQVYNINGQLVETLVDGNVDTGYHSVTWNAENYPSGIYFAKLIAGDFTKTQKLVLVK
ncbi:MAG: T9SS type A sorting domain-containing protein [Candidatus Marinimicrobia bacterium]|nr:T9SS type A sorting domain-containing protein [Candidatus Neomarinimicrobiota bacterium]MBL7023188.1 T9SS type A sorting domain-containing protein [Candidatus Neomarinimicrobiota bacterium]MBL7109243.1 T9SS type A sorting domain-containing protein [Candidatus Neomarinimicrobiota bacterium]